MNHDKVVAILSTLSGEFGVKCPKVRVYKSSWFPKGRYHPSRRLISLGQSKKIGHLDNEQVLLHEFAHYLHHCREKTRDNADTHGPYFVGRLFEIAEFWYGDASLYNWKVEYPSVYRVYKNRYLKAA